MAAMSIVCPHGLAWLAAVVAVLLGTLLNGCATAGSATESSSRETLPWNQPASWEGKILGAPF